MHKAVIGVVVVFLLIMLWLAVDYFFTTTIIGSSNISVKSVDLVEENGRYYLRVIVHFGQTAPIPLISKPKASITVLVDNKLFGPVEEIVKGEEVAAEIPVSAEDVYWLVNFAGVDVSVSLAISSLWGVSRTLEFSAPLHVVFS